MGRAVKAKRLSLEEIFRMAKSPEDIEKLLLEHGYVTRKGLREADRLVKERINLLKRLK